MRIRSYFNNKIAFCCLLSVTIWLGVWFLIRIRNKIVPNERYRALEEEICSNKDNLDIAEELYKVGYLLFVKGHFNESDRILRYIVLNYPSWNEWCASSEAVLLSRKFSEFYSNQQGVTNPFALDNIPDEALVDRESVRRKYGSPSRVEKGDDLYEEKWIYYTTNTQGEAETGEFCFRKGGWVGKINWTGGHRSDRMFRSRMMYIPEREEEWLQ